MEIYRGKGVVITGAASGIGRALAINLAAMGARLALTDVNIEGLEETKSLCGDGVCNIYRVDVASRTEMFGLADAVKHDFGKVDYLFNNAGVALAASINNATLEEMEWIVNINLWGVVYGTKAFLPIFLSQGDGHVVNISSVMGLVGYPSLGAYCLTKFGVRGLTETLWRELEGTGVCATSVHPAGTATGITRGVRMGQYADETDREDVERQARGHKTTPDQAARKILAGVARRKRRIIVSNGSWIVQFLSRMFPSSYPTLMRRMGF